MSPPTAALGPARRGPHSAEPGGPKVGAPSGQQGLRKGTASASVLGPDFFPLSMRSPSLPGQHPQPSGFPAVEICLLGREANGEAGRRRESLAVSSGTPPSPLAPGPSLASRRPSSQNRKCRKAAVLCLYQQLKIRCVRAPLHRFGECKYRLSLSSVPAFCLKSL